MCSMLLTPQLVFFRNYVSKELSLHWLIHVYGHNDVQGIKSAKRFCLEIQSALVCLQWWRRWKGTQTHTCMKYTLGDGQTEITDIAPKVNERVCSSCPSSDSCICAIHDEHVLSVSSALVSVSDWMCVQCACCMWEWPHWPGLVGAADPAAISGNHQAQVHPQTAIGGPGVRPDVGARLHHWELDLQSGGVCVCGVGG